MEPQYLAIIKTAYEGFNARDIDRVLEVMDPDIHWPKAFEGGHVVGQDAVRAYWTRQWTEINPIVEPRSIVELPDGRVEVLVNQLVKDLEGNVLFDGPTKHIYTFSNNRLYRMDIEAV
jgi:nuclear transport factor 2 (NTF2) superfamily protein